MKLHVEVEKLIEGEAEMKSGKRNVWSFKLERITSLSVLSVMLLNLTLGTAIAGVHEKLWTRDADGKQVKVAELSVEGKTLSEATYKALPAADNDVLKKVQDAMKEPKQSSNGYQIAQGFFIGLKEQKNETDFKNYQAKLLKAFEAASKDSNTKWPKMFKEKREVSMEDAIMKLAKKVLEKMKFDDFKKFKDEEEFLKFLFEGADARDLRDAFGMEDKKDETTSPSPTPTATPGTTPTPTPVSSAGPTTSPAAPTPTPAGPTIAPSNPPAPRQPVGEDSQLDELEKLKQACIAGRAREDKLAKDNQAIGEALAKAIADLGNKQNQLAGLAKPGDDEAKKALKDAIGKALGGDKGGAQTPPTQFPQPVAAQKEKKDKGAFNRNFGNEEKARPNAGALPFAGIPGGQPKPLPGQVKVEWQPPAEFAAGFAELSNGEKELTKLRRARSQATTQLQFGIPARALVSNLDSAINNSRKKATRLKTSAKNIMRVVERKGKALESLLNEGGLAKLDKLKREVPKQERKLEQLKSQSQQCQAALQKATSEEAEGLETLQAQCTNLNNQATQLESFVEETKEEMELGEQAKAKGVKALQGEFEAAVAQASDMNEFADDLEEEADKTETQKTQLQQLAQAEAAPAATTKKSTTAFGNKTSAPARVANTLGGNRGGTTGRAPLRSSDRKSAVGGAN